MYVNVISLLASNAPKVSVALRVTVMVPADVPTTVNTPPCRLTLAIGPDWFSTDILTASPFGSVAETL